MSYHKQRQSEATLDTTQWIIIKHRATGVVNAALTAGLHSPLWKARIADTQLHTSMSRFDATHHSLTSNHQPHNEAAGTAIGAQELLSCHIIQLSSQALQHELAMKSRLGTSISSDANLILVLPGHSAHQSCRYCECSSQKPCDSSFCTWYCWKQILIFTTQARIASHITRSDHED